MNQQTGNHPQPEALIDFGLGKLDAEKSSAIEEHLSECEDCCETLLNLQDDTFTGLVRSLPEPNRKTSDGVTEGAVDRDESRNAPTMLVSREESGEISDLAAELRNHPRYRIVEQIGQGGMGNVYRAEHKLMNRPVALKVINSQLVNHPQAVERFRREVQAAARLTHPNIVTAFDAEQAGDVHFLVMEFVKGRELASIVKERGPLPVSEACDCIRQAAEGLQHAHEHKMVHRDIKPHNLMLSPNGQVRILDFGLAGFASETALIETVSNADASAQHLTTIGSVMGTPDYISPEQARDAHTADIRSDIYSLGCTLYFLLTGKPPFPAESVADKLKAHAEDEPPAIEAIRVDVPEELAEVIRRMLAKNPNDRFQTPAEVADALAPFVELHATVQGGGSSHRPPRRWGLRGRFVAAALLLAGIIFVVTDRGRIEITTSVDDVQVVVKQDGKEITIIDLQTGSKIEWLPSGHYQLSLKTKSNDVELKPNRVTISRWGKEIVKISPLPHVAEIVATDRELLQGTWITESELRNGQPISLAESGIQRMVFNGEDVEFVYPQGRSLHSRFELDESTDPKQLKIIAVGLNKILRGIYKIEGDRLTTYFQEDPSGDLPNSFAATGRARLELIVLRRASSANSELPPHITGHNDKVSSLSFAPDGAQVLSGDNSGTLLLNDVATGRQLREFSGHTRSIRSVSFSTDGKQALSSGWDNTIRLWDVASGQPLVVIQDKSGLLHTAALNPEGNQILSCSHISSAGAIRLWDVRTGELLKEFEGVTFQPFEVVYSPTGEQALSGAHDALMRLWDVKTGKVIREFRGHRDWVRTVAFSTDGRLAVSGSKDNTIRVWEIETGELKRTLYGHTDLVESAVFTPDARRIVSASLDGTVRLWDVETGEELAGVGSPNQGLCVAISPDGRTAAFGGEDKLIHLWRFAEPHPNSESRVTEATTRTANQQKAEQSHNAAMEAAQKWFELLDAGEYGKCWDEMASKAKAELTREGLIAQCERSVKPRGKVLDRTWEMVTQSIRERRNPEGLMEITCHTKFENAGELTETLLLHLDTDGQWRVGAHSTSRSKKAPGETPDEQEAEANKNAAIEAAEKWLELLDAGEYGKCWDEMDSKSKEVITREEQIRRSERSVKQRGKVLSRTLASVVFNRLELHNSEGSMNLRYETKFDKGGEMTDILVLRFDNDGEWRVAAQATQAMNPRNSGQPTSDQEPVKR